MSKTAREVLEDVEVAGKYLPMGDYNADKVIATLAAAGFVIVPKDFLIKLTERLSDSGQMPNNSYMEGRNATLAR